MSITFLVIRRDRLGGPPALHSQHRRLGRANVSKHHAEQDPGKSAYHYEVHMVNANPFGQVSDEWLRRHKIHGI